MPLTDTQVKNAKAKAKPYRLPDGKGLHLHVATSGTKTWQYRYKLDGKEKLATLGEYPAMSLSDARQARMEARELVKRGVNVTERQRAQKQANLEAAQAAEAEQAALANTFATVAKDWHERQQLKLNAETWKNKWNSLTNHVFPALGDKPVTQITRQDLVAVMRSMEAVVSGATAGRIGTYICSVFTFAQNMGLIDANPATNLKSVLKAHVTEHFKEPSREQMAALLPLLALKPPTGKRGEGPHPIIRAALLFTILTVARSKEVRLATWEEIDLDKRLWRRPAEHMKTGRAHTVPLSRQALAVLDFVKLLPGGGEGLLFSISKNKELSTKSMLGALRYSFSMDFHVHGLRAFFLTEANGLGVFRERAVGACLAHSSGGDGFQSDAVYDRGDYLEQRKPIMRWYGDWLEAMQKSGKVEEPADFLPPELRHRTPQGL